MNEILYRLIMMDANTAVITKTHKGLERTFAHLASREDGEYVLGLLKADEEAKKLHVEEAADISSE